MYHATATPQTESPAQAISEDAGPAAASAPDPAAASEASPRDPEAPRHNAHRHVPRGGTGWLSRLLEKMEAALSRLSTRNNFWHRCFSWVFLPLAYRSGIRMKHVKGGSNFSVVLPFRRFNKNWYSAMAGAALLGNTEVAGGMFVFNKCGGGYTVVCKHLAYKFLRPCYGPAIYNIEPRGDLDALAASGEEFNVTLDVNIVQAVRKKDKKERRVGRAEIAFHATPKKQARARMQRRITRLKEAAHPREK